MESMVPSHNEPGMPCAFERLGPPGAPQDAELGGAYVQGLYGMSVEAPSSLFNVHLHWASPAAAKAAALALRALSSPPREARAVAEAALALCSDCGDAWSARALRCAEDLQEALLAFQHAVRAATAALSPSLLAELAASRGLTVAQRDAAAARHPWDVHPCRPLVRAMAGEANTLRKLGRWAEAADAYERLHALDAFSHVACCAWVNWKAHVPATLLAAGRLARCRAYMRDPDNAPCCTDDASALHWHGAAALVDFATHFAGRPAAWAPDVVPPPGAALMESTCVGAPGIRFADVARGDAAAGNAAACFAFRYPHAAAYFVLGDAAAPAPPAGAVAAMLSCDSERRAHAAVWAAAAVPAWVAAEAHWPGARAWLRRMHCTFQLLRAHRGVVTPMPAGPAAALLPPVPPLAPLSPAAHIAAVAVGDVYVYMRGTGTRGSLLCLAAMTEAEDAALLRALLDAGASLEQSRARDVPSAMQRWAYYAGPPAALKLLLERGAAPAAPEAILEAAFMAANQANAAHLAALLAALDAPFLARPGVGKQLLEQVVCSTVPRCLARRTDPVARADHVCQRCEADDRPHSAAASVARTMGVLAAAGVLDVMASDPLARARAFAPHEQGGVLRAWEPCARALGRGDAARCALCGVAAAGGAPLRRCSRCRGVRFCGDDGMRAAWPTHKASCKRPADE